MIRTSVQDDSIPNYDIRTAKEVGLDEYFSKARQDVGKDAAVVADIREGFVRGEDALKQRLPQVKFEYNEDIRTPEVITPDVYKATIEWLTPASSMRRSEILRNFAKENNELVGVNDSQVDALRVLTEYTNPDGNISYAHLEQRIDGVPIFRSELKAGFTKDGRIIRVINNLAPGLDYESLSRDFGDPMEAVRAAGRHINFEPKDLSNNDSQSTNLVRVYGRGDNATTAEKMYFPTEPGIAVPAWKVLIYTRETAYYVIVDGHTGTMLWRKNIGNDQTQSATYNVYRNATGYIPSADSPAPLSPGPLDPTAGTQGVNATRSNVTLIGNEGTNSFNNNGWITDGANITDGNAVEAGIDRVAPDGVDAPQTGSPNRVFDAPTWNPPPGSPAPGDDPLTAAAQRGAVIQMFYVMNLYHDELYKRGFTEPAFNFQNDNFGRGGAGADRVRAEGQDSSGTNNANFLTPADGGRGRMQMFLWTGPTPDYDGTADAEVIIHEVTHGTSNRLHGNTSGLSTNMSQGMGEGWGDFYGYSMLADPSDPINGVYTTGGYATFLIAAGFTGNYYYGIRRFPRAPITFLGTNGRPHNPFTFRYVNAGCATLVDGSTSAFPRGPIGVAQCDQVHNLGEIWSSMLWEVRNRMVTRLGFTAGTARVLQVVTDGMKLAPIGPTFIQERNAIIAAAAALPVAPEASADVADVREGFRVRGMGFSASIQSASPAAVTEAFDFPNALITNPIAVSDPGPGGDGDGFPEPGETVQISVPVQNSTGVTMTNVIVTATGGGSANYGSITDGTTETLPVSFTISAAALCGSQVTVPLTLSSDAGTQPVVNFSMTLGAPQIGLTQNFDGVTPPALPAGWTQVQTSGTGITWTTVNTTPNSAPNAAFANDPTPVNASAIVTPAFNVTSTAASVTFRNNFNTEDTFDGMVLEVKIGAGAFTDIVTAGGAFTAGGYTDTISTAFSSPIAGRMAWSGNSGGYITSTATLPAAANGQSVQLRWLMASDVSVTGVGVRIDDISVVNGYQCTSPPLAVRSRADFDGDGRSDVSVFRPSEGNWYLNRSTDGFVAFAWGTGTDQLVPGDYDNDNKTDTAIFRPTADGSQPDFYILRSNGFVVSGVSWGIAGDIPVVADYDNDGRTDVAVYRPSDNTWYVHNSSTGLGTFTVFGQAGDVPVAGNFGGTAGADLTVYRSGGWFSQLSGGGTLTTSLGAAGDILVPADYSGDNVDDMSVFRPSTGEWYIRNSTGGAVSISTFGIPGDVPVPGDYDGDGRDDLAIFRGGTWWILRSNAGILVQGFGFGTDKPIPRSYIP